MALRRRVTVACALFAVGAIASVPFYRANHDSAKARAHHSLPPDSQSASTVVLQIPSDPERNGEDTHGRTVSSAAPGIRSRPTLRQQPVERDSEWEKPPQISSDFPGVSQQVPPVSTRRRQEGSASSAPASPAAPRDQDGDGPSLHRIRDGDTLRAIARKYLGDSDRWQQIVEINPDVLKDPEVLPVGKEIRIPDRRIAAGQENEPLTPLVPIR